MIWDSNDKDFIEWLKNNQIIYNTFDTDLMNALYAEFIIEKNSKQ